MADVELLKGDAPPTKAEKRQYYRQAISTVLSVMAADRMSYHDGQIVLRAILSLSDTHANGTAPLTQESFDALLDTIFDDLEAELNPTGTENPDVAVH